MKSRQKPFKFEKLERKTNNTFFVLLVFFFFEISEKTDCWTLLIRESAANLIFRFVPHSVKSGKGNMA
ncbi:hypothetical protein LIU_03805 [Enterococcus durans]|nr:hypothetical protein LIANG_08880 [Enterococcus durans]AKZ47632.1 hypothetical protein LIU_03805 [Enterococcus durans]